MANDARLALVDKGKGTVLVLIDLSAAFDAADHRVRLERPRHRFGLDGLRVVPDIILRGWVGRRHFFVLWGEGCFVDKVSEGWGDNLSWGSRRI